MCHNQLDRIRSEVTYVLDDPINTIHSSITKIFVVKIIRRKVEVSIGIGICLNDSVYRQGVIVDLHAPLKDHFDRRLLTWQEIFNHCVIPSGTDDFSRVIIKSSGYVDRGEDLGSKVLYHSNYHFFICSLQIGTMA